MCTVESSKRRTAHCGHSGVFIMEVLLYRKAHCGHSGVLITEVSLYMYISWNTSGLMDSRKNAGKNKHMQTYTSLYHMGSMGQHNTSSSRKMNS